MSPYYAFSFYFLLSHLPCQQNPLVVASNPHTIDVEALIIIVVVVVVTIEITRRKRERVDEGERNEKRSEDHSCMRNGTPHCNGVY